MMMAFEPLRRGLGLGLLLVGLLAASPALAEGPSAADRETARALMDKGHGAYDSGRFGEALRPFEQAHALMKLPTTGLWLARTREKLGLLVLARDVAVEVSRLPVQAKESEALTKARRDAESLAAALAPRIPTLELSVVGAPAESVTVLVDGEPLSRAALGIPRKLDPGCHTLVARAEGYRAVEQEVELAEGSTKQVVLTLERGSTEAPLQAGSPTSGEQRGLPTLAYVGFGLGAVGLAAGSVTGVLALSRAADAEAQCTAGRCPPSARDDIETSNTFADVSTVSFGVGLAGLALGVFAVVTAEGGPPEKASLPVRAQVGLGTLTLEGSF
jgi:hypothetical protein